jgi:ParB-like chromosome segregation protein Spo0J
MMKVHPFADLLPPMTEAEYDALRESIRDNGQREPITLYRGLILDGRNRQRACDELGIKVATRTFTSTDSEALAYMLDLNVNRRHLSESQRAMIAKRLETLKQGRPGKDANLHVSRDDAARLLNVSPRSIASAGTVLKRAEPEIVAAVERGVMAVSTAAYIAAKPREQQLGRLARDQRKIDGTHQQKDGFYRTPTETTRALLKVEKFRSRVWELACGDGAISKVLIEAGYEVVSTDLIDRGYGEGMAASARLDACSRNTSSPASGCSPPGKPCGTARMMRRKTTAARPPTRGLCLNCDRLVRTAGWWITRADLPATG